MKETFYLFLGAFFIGAGFGIIWGAFCNTVLGMNLPILACGGAGAVSVIMTLFLATFR